MEYIKRKLERKFLRMSSFFKAVLVTGARQVGKTTMLRHLCEGQNRTYVTLDNMMARTLAQTDPVLFFQTYKPPILIDEVQYAPELFAQIKILCDESEQTGQFWLTGSQRYKVMKNVQETLAGRVGVLTLYGLSQREKDGILLEDSLDFSLPCLQKDSALFKRTMCIPFLSISGAEACRSLFMQTANSGRSILIPILIPISCVTSPKPAVLRTIRVLGSCCRPALHLPESKSTTTH